MSSNANQVPDFIKLLAHDLRWAMLTALATSDYQVNELVNLVGQPMNLVSYHLKQLREDGLVSTRRSESDGRDIYYSLDLEELRARFQTVGLALHPAVMTTADFKFPDKFSVRRVLFVCTHNSARSQMAEGFMRHLSAGRIEVFSAGSQPGTVHPEAVRTMKRFGVDVADQKSTHLETFDGQAFDYVVTVCDLAREICPTFSGDGIYIHWGFPDPAVIADSRERRDAFERTALRLQTRILHFLAWLNVTEDIPA